MTPDLFSKEIITYSVDDFSHNINYSKHTESLVITATPNYESDFEEDDKMDDKELTEVYDPRESETFYLLKDVPQDSIWMSLLDFDASDAPKTLDAFAFVEKALDCLSFLDLSKKEFPQPGSGFARIPFEARILDDFDNISDKILNYLKEAMTLKPALRIFFPFFHLNLHQLWNEKYLKKNKSVIFHSDLSFSTLSMEIANFRDYYSQAREAMYSIFTRPEELRLPIAPNESAELYKIYAALHQIRLFNRLRSSEYGDRYEKETWDDFLVNNWGIAFNDSYGFAFPSFKKMIFDAIDNLASTNTVLRKCALCGGYFKTKYGSKQTCCSRQYRNTKTTCYEYASRKSYKEKLQEHPVYQEYIKAYNRLYGRIRRKTVPANTPLADQLKDLRDEYYEKYDSADPSQQDAVLQELSRRCDQLLT